MSITKTEYAQGTSITRSYPWGINVACVAMCPDGIARKCKRIASAADTFFSTPASVTAKGRTVAGYVTVGCASGLSTPTDDDPAIVYFRPYTNRKNHAIFGAEVLE